MNKEWETWWQEVLDLAINAKVQSIIVKSKNLYREYYDNGVSPEDAYMCEWG